ncbi:hypothetical protein D3C86_964500 [compost metagenome]
MGDSQINSSNVNCELIGKTFVDLHCNGFFGSGNYEAKTVETVGNDWIVVRGENGLPYFASFTNGWEDKMYELINDWLKES